MDDSWLLFVLTIVDSEKPLKLHDMKLYGIRLRNALNISVLSSSFKRTTIQECNNITLRNIEIGKELFLMNCNDLFLINCKIDILYLNHVKNSQIIDSTIKKLINNSSDNIVKFHDAVIDKNLTKIEKYQYAPF
jgi:hypothetical protein